MQVHKKNKAEKRLIQKIKIFFIYVVFLIYFFYIIFINKQIKKEKNQLCIALTSFTHAVCSFNLVYSGRIIEK